MEKGHCEDQEVLDAIKDYLPAYSATLDDIKSTSTTLALNRWRFTWLNHDDVIKLRKQNILNKIVEEDKKAADKLAKEENKKTEVAAKAQRKIIREEKTKSTAAAKDLKDREKLDKKRKTEEPVVVTSSSSSNKKSKR